MGGQQTGWRCECGFMNRAKNQICGGMGGKLGCKTARATAWTCSSCGFDNRPKNQICGGVNGTLGCKQPRPAPWTCECGFVNKAQNTQCGGQGGSLGCKKIKSTPSMNPENPPTEENPFPSIEEGS